jgi:hypothetical protein
MAKGLVKKKIENRKNSKTTDVATIQTIAIAANLRTKNKIR